MDKIFVTNHTPTFILAVLALFSLSHIRWCIREPWMLMKCVLCAGKTSTKQTTVMHGETAWSHERERKWQERKKEQDA